MHHVGASDMWDSCRDLHLWRHKSGRHHKAALRSVDIDDVAMVQRPVDERRPWHTLSERDRAAHDRRDRIVSVPPDQDGG